MIYEKCRDILLRESEFLQEAGNLQEKIRLAVMDREWSALEDNFQAIHEIEDRIAELEIEREQLFTVFSALVCAEKTDLDPKDRFGVITSHLPQTQRNDLTSIYKNLKIEAQKLRLATESFTTYLDGIKSTINEFFSLVFPERAGTRYTQYGTHCSHDLRSLVLNQSF